MGDQLDRMRRAVQGKPSTAPKAEPPPRPAKPPKPAKAAKKPPPSKPQTRYSCGHAVGVPTDIPQPCPCCVNKVRREKRAARIALREAKPKPVRGGRLPDGARFEVFYDATKMCWAGTLTIPGVDPVSGTESGVFRLLKNLDQQFREVPPMRAMRQERRGQFRATAANGRVFVVDVIANVHITSTLSGPPREVDGMFELKTAEGYSVNHLGGDRFEVIDLHDPSPHGTPVTSDDPTISRLWEK